MDFVNSLLPTQEQIYLSLQNPSIKKLIHECNKFKRALKDDYYQFGAAVHRVQPWSFAWIIASLARCIFPSFDRAYTCSLGKLFTRVTHKDFLTKCDTLVNTVAMGVIERVDQHKNVIPYSVGTEVSFYCKTHEWLPDARGAMEYLVWTCAQIVDMDDFFVPTSIYEGVGCLQPHIRGRFIDDISNFLPQRIELIDGALVALLFGLADANISNVIVDKDGHFRFIDNTRCFTHSNDFVRFGADVVTSFRCGLMQCADFYSDLSPDDVEHVRSRVAHFRACLPKLIEALEAVDDSIFPADNDPEIARKFWFKKDYAIAALTERVDRMERAVIDGSYASLRDFVFAVHPGYRLAAAITFAAASASDKHIKRRRELLIHYSSVEEERRDEARVILQCEILCEISGFEFSFCKMLDHEQFVVDLDELFTKCTDTAIPFDEIIDWIANAPGITPNSDEKRDDLWQELFDKAKPDHKT